MEAVLLTGSTGFVGRAFTRALLEQGRAAEFSGDDHLFEHPHTYCVNDSATRARRKIQACGLNFPRI